MPSDINWDFLITLGLWAVALVVVIRPATRDRPVAGLLLAYYASLALIHLVAGLVLLLPWYKSPNRAYNLSGFAITGYAVAGFLIGHVLYLLLGKRKPSRGLPLRADDEATERLALVCIFVGIGSYFAILGLLFFIPGMAAIAGNGLNLTTGGCCLLWWNHYRHGRQLRAWWAVASILILPVMTVLLHGFLGFGIAAVLTALTLLAVHHRPRWPIVLGAPAILFLGLSVYTVYLDIRGQIRGAVWGESTFAERVLVTSSAANEQWDWFDPTDKHHLQNIDMRLNQNLFLGISAQRMDRKDVAFAQGETLLNALIALMPRIVWQEKPKFAGSGKLVTRFTGVEFAGSTSVGIGHVMELFVNFGRTGVLLGSMVIGFILSALDRQAGASLYSGVPRGFILFFVPSQTFLMVGGTFAEVPPAAVGSLILCFLCFRINDMVFPRSAKRLNVRRPDSPGHLKDRNYLHIPGPG